MDSCFLSLKEIPFLFDITFSIVEQLEFKFITFILKFQLFFLNYTNPKVDIILYKLKVFIAMSDLQSWQRFSPFSVPSPSPSHPPTTPIQIIRNGF